MAAVDIVPGVFWTGVRDPSLRVFDVIMKAPHGTTYNAYLVKGQDKIALIDTVKEHFLDEYLAKIRELVPLSDIAYLVVNHTEPDHAGSVGKLLELIPDLKVVGSPTAIKFLQGIVNRAFNSLEVGDGDSIDLGQVTLQFIQAPFLHWPDSMFTYVPEKEIIFTCDAFGAHWADDRLFLDDIEQEYLAEYEYYFDVLMKPFSSYVRQALAKIQGLPISCVCPGHGLLLRNNWRHYIDLYRQWAGEEPGLRLNKVTVLYVSAYGYTKELASYIIEGLQSAGDFEVQSLDLAGTAVDEAVKAVRDSGAVLIGSPTIMGDALPPVWDLLTRLSPITDAGKIAAAFGSYGWSGEAVPNMENRLRSLRMKVLPGLKVNFKPSPPDLDKAFMFGYQFGQHLLEAAKPAEARKWRCTVCGQVYQGTEPPPVCPACGASQENFVQVPEEEVEFTSSTPYSVIIIGSGAAAVAAAEAARKRNQVCSIRIISEDSHLPYYRPALSDLLAEDLSDEELFIHPESWYRDNNIELILGTKIMEIDISGKSVKAEDGRQFLYDRLVIATGSRSNVLPSLPGFNKEGVFTLRSLDDCLRLKEFAKKSRAAVIVGGGVLGLEAAWAFRQVGLEVTVIENAPRLLPRQLDESGSKILEEAVLKSGVNVVRGAALEEVVGEDKVAGVKLSDGRILPADIVLFSIGVTPNTELAKAAGIEVNRGIVVDSRMSTSAADVFSAGDVAEFSGTVSGLWPQALEQGRVAGACAVGDWQEYKPGILATYLDAFGITVFAAGDVGSNPETIYKTVEVRDPAQNSYKKYYFVDGVLKGAVVIGPKVTATGVLAALEASQTRKRRGQRWQCLRCGYIHEGPEPPDICPVCGAPKNMFVPID